MTGRLAAIALVVSACTGGVAPAHPTRPSWTALASATDESLRGLSIVSRDVLWASGAHGTVVRSIDGASFTRCATPSSADALDFRSLHALDASHALVLSAGAPARLFATSDACRSWVQLYAREGEGVFFDSLVMRGDDEGVALGDPMPAADGARFALLATHDGGRSWMEREGPIAMATEAAFAASNGCIAWPSASLLVFATSAARALRSTDGGTTWTSASIAVPSSASAGVFAIAFRDARDGYAVGGDYASPTLLGSFARTHDGGVSWQAGAAPRGYRSSIAVVGRTLVVVGTSGSDVSYDDGASWIAIDDLPLNAVRAIGDVVVAVGPGGAIVRLVSGGSEARAGR